MAGDGAASRQMASRLTNTSNIEAFIPHYMDILKGLFAFAFVWGFGGHLHDRFVVHVAVNRWVCNTKYVLVFD